MKKDNLDLKFIETLVMSKIEDKPREERDAKAIVKKFFAAHLYDCYDLTNPTYQSRIDKKEWMKEARILSAGVTMKFKIRKIKVQSGCLTIVKGIFKVIKDGAEHSRDMSIQLMRERAPYEPDSTAEMRISGTTVPPFLVPTK